jgi:hypothetical protein
MDDVVSLFLPGLGVTAMQFICCKNESIVSTLLICAFGMDVVLSLWLPGDWSYHCHDFLRVRVLKISSSWSSTNYRFELPLQCSLLWIVQFYVSVIFNAYCCIIHV